MKHVGSFISKLAVCSLALLVTSSAASVQAAEDTARVMAVRGSAQYSEEGQWRTLQVGKRLSAGTVVRTASNSSVDLFMRHNGPVVRITADTMLGLDKMFFEQTGDETVIETQLNLTNGRILGNVKKMAAASKYEVKIPTGTVGIRGTDYDISATGVISIMDGSARIIYPGPTGPVEVILNAGNTFAPATTPGQPPTVGPTPPEMQQNINIEYQPVRELLGRIDPGTDDIIIPDRAIIERVPEVPVIEQPLSPTTGLP